MWNGRDPGREITFDGAKFGAVDEWSHGIITRGTGSPVNPLALF
jgi:hypothetical protein